MLQLSKMTFLISEKSMQKVQIIRFVKFVLGKNQLTYSHLNDVLKYGC